MSDLISLVHDWPEFVLALVAFGFAPGFVLRLIVLLYPHSDGRRAELVAELYELPRWKRPMWVAEQLETAIWEGPRERRRQRSGRPLWQPLVDFAGYRTRSAPRSSQAEKVLRTVGATVLLWLVLAGFGPSGVTLRGFVNAVSAGFSLGLLASLISFVVIWLVAKQTDQTFED